MRSSKALILALVGFLVFGSAGLFGYMLFIRPYTNYSFFNCDKKAKKVDSKITPDPSLAAFDAAVALQVTGKLLEAQAAWQTWLSTYPHSSKKKEAMITLGKINMELLHTPPADSKENYIVLKGDSLDRIARKQKSNPELIQRLNNLPSTNLQIGEVLFVPQLSTNLEIDRKEGLLILKNHSQFLKAYALLSSPSEGPQKKPAQTTTIVDRVALSGNKRTAFGDKKYSSSKRIIILRSCCNIVAAPPPPPPTTVSDIENKTTEAPTVMLAGFVISTEDMKEIFPFVTKETSVIID